MKYVCGHGCEVEVGMSKRPPRSCEPHGSPLVYAKALKRTTSLEPGRKRPARKPLKRTNGFAASKAQREKVRGLPCAICGKEASTYRAIDPAHVWPRGKGGCDHEDCVIPGCRTFDGTGCHTLLDLGELEALPALISRGYWAELAHPIACHQVSPTSLVARLTLPSAYRQGEEAVA